MLEKESFRHIPLRNFDSQSETEIDVKAIPTPDQIPEAFPVEDLPEEILRSSTVETLINQNEDLMARLKVNIKRFSMLEKDFIKARRELEDAQKSSEILSEQNMLYKEKDESWLNKIRNLQERIDQAQQDRDVAELKYTEHYEFSQERVNDLQSKNRSLETKLTRHQRYRGRIIRWIRPLIANFKTRTDILEDQLRSKNGEWLAKLESQRNLLKGELEDWQAKYESTAKDLESARENHKVLKRDLEQKSKELSRRVEELSSYIQKQGTDHSQEMTQLKSRHQKRVEEIEKKQKTSVGDLSKTITKLSQDLALQKEKASRANSFKEKNIVLENKLVKEERKTDELRQKFDHELAAQSQVVTSLQKRISELESQNKKLDINCNRFQNEAQKSKIEQRQWMNQFRSAQMVIDEKNTELRQLEEQNKDLLGLNEELKKAMEEKSKAKSFEFKGQSKKKEEKLEKAEQDKLEHINNLLAKIQSGYSFSEEKP